MASRFLCSPEIERVRLNPRQIVKEQAIDRFNHDEGKNKKGGGYKPVTGWQLDRRYDRGMAKRKNRGTYPMKMSPASTEQVHTFTIPAARTGKPIQVRITIEFVESENSLELEPLLGDGFVPPDTLRCAGKTLILTRKEYDLLHLLATTDEKRMEVFNVGESLNMTPASIKTTASRINARFSDEGIQFWWGDLKVTGDWVILEPS